MSDTPLTDAEQDDARNVALEFTCRNPQPLPGENCYVVSADFARELERELNALKFAHDTPRTDALGKMVQEQNWGYRDMRLLAETLERELNALKKMLTKP